MWYDISYGMLLVARLFDTCNTKFIRRLYVRCYHRPGFLTDLDLTWYFSPVLKFSDFFKSLFIPEATLLTV